MTRGRARLWLSLGIAMLACTCAPTPPVLQGEVLIVADTDMTVPTYVNRLRIDVYSVDGATWYSSRDTDRSHAGDWPASFAVSLSDAETERLAVVRLRAYPAGAVRDYRGERFFPKQPGNTSTALASPAMAFKTASCPACPRLIVGGGDVTQASEPAPLQAVDQLVVVRVKPGVRGAVRVVLRGVCVGTMADLYGLRSCIDTDGLYADVNEAPIDPDMTVSAASLAGTFEQAYDKACTARPRAGGTTSDGTPLHDDRICVPGGVFVFGSLEGFGVGAIDDVPVRFAAMPPVLMDKYEVTVARWRAALAAGTFESPDASPTDNPGPVPTTNASGVVSTDPATCTWTAVPRPAAERREEYPLSCVSWAAARALCRTLGGDLPTEAQWEYAATAAGAGVRVKRNYPWGLSLAGPTCAQAVWGRGDDPALTDHACNSDGGSFGPQPVTAADLDGGDRTPAMDDAGAFLVDLGGNMSEWTLDAIAPFQSSCWLGAPVVSPSCAPGSGPGTLRGGFWAASSEQVVAAVREVDQAMNFFTFRGFRCVYPGGS